MTTIEKIKAEIERRITDNTFGAKLELIDILAWLDTLESEKPINPDDAMKELDEKIALVKQRGTWDGVDVDKYMDEVRGREPEKPMNLEEEIKRFVAEYGYERSEDILLIAIVARQFYELGCRRAAEKFDEIEYNRQRAEESVPKDLEEAAHLFSQSPEPLYSPGHRFHWDDDALFGKQIETTFIAGAKWQAEQDEKEQADLFTIVALDAAQRAKEQMMKDIPKWHKVQRGSCFDKYTDFLLSAREGHFYCSSIEVPRDGYILLVDELERLPKEDEK